MFSLTNKRIVVTGASSGIGRAISITLAKFGATVILLGRDETRLKETLKQMEGAGHKFFGFDIKDYSCLKNFIVQSEPYDGIVFNAGVVEYSPVKFLNETKIQAVFQTNFNANVILCQQLLKSKLVKKKGSLVFLSSISSVLGVPGTAIYSASKAAIKTFSKVTASEVSNLGIRSNSISPGIVITPMTEEAIQISSKDKMEKNADDYPLGYGTPEDVAALVLYLVSDASKWMTGNDLILDGGLTLK